MKAVGYKVPGPIAEDAALVDIDLPRPVAAGHDILVEVKAVSVNPVDYKIRSSTPPADGDYSARHSLRGRPRMRRASANAGYNLPRRTHARCERQSDISLPMSTEPKQQLRPELSADGRARFVFALEVGSNDPAASAETRARAERLLHLQRLLGRARHSND